MEYSVSLLDLIEIIKKRKWILILITSLFVAASIILSFFVLPPIYEAKYSVIIGKDETGSRDPMLSYNDVLMYQKLVKTYSTIAKSNKVAELTAESMGEPDKKNSMANLIVVSPQPDTQIIDVKVRSSDPEEAYKIANIHSVVFVREATNLILAGTVKVMDNISFPEVPVKPNKKLNIMIAFVLGIMVSLGLIFLIEFMDKTIKTRAQLEEVLDFPVIGVIPLT